MKKLVKTYIIEIYEYHDDTFSKQEIKDKLAKTVKNSIKKKKYDKNRKKI